MIRLADFTAAAAVIVSKSALTPALGAITLLSQNFPRPRL
jgi:hypothetical protein